MKEIVYRCDYCKEVLKEIAVGVKYDSDVISKVTEKMEDDSFVELFCNWSCHMKRMNEKFPTYCENGKS